LEDPKQPEPELDRRDAVMRCREQLALAMTRLNQAHWELDRLVEEWLAQAAPGGHDGRLISARSLLKWAVSRYDEAFGDVVAVLSGEDCSTE
jgi:hypothetical protein